MLSRILSKTFVKAYIIGGIAVFLTAQVAIFTVLMPLYGIVGDGGETLTNSHEQQLATAQVVVKLATIVAYLSLAFVLLGVSIMLHRYLKRRK